MARKKREQLRYEPQKIDSELLRQIVKAKAPATPKEIRDKAQGLVLRHQPTGHAALYALGGRGQRKRICTAIDIVDATRPQTLRWAICEARKFQGKAAAGELVPVERTKTPTLRQFIDGTVSGHKFRDTVAKGEPERILAAFASILDRQLDKISPLDLARFAKRQIDKGRKPASILRPARNLHAALEKAVQWKLISTNPLAGAIKSKGRVRLAEIALQPIERRVRYLTPDEETRLRETLRSRDGRARDYLLPAVITSMLTGLRRGEQFKLTWGDVDFGSKQLTVRASTAKAGKTRHVAMCPEAVEILKAWKPDGADNKDFVFITPKGQPIIDPKKAFNALVRAAGISGFTWHDLRHTFASKLAMQGVDLLTIKELLGHSSVRMTEVYAHLQPHRHHEAVARLG
jgi:integrase